MSDPILWYMFAGLFVLAAILNFARSKRRLDYKGQVNKLLGASCILWAAASLTFRFANIQTALVAAIGAGVMMLIAAFISAKNASYK